MSAAPIRLHLGCGEIYLPGYVNVDFPSAQHSVQAATRADVYTDIRTLDYPPESVGEVRLHHVFEHFTRGTALGLLISWYGWLAEDGKPVIETPDFEGMLREFGRGRRPDRQALALRHIFGSHEADWAVHCDGWYQQKFDHVLPKLGFRDVELDRSEWRGTYNITATAHKRRPYTVRPEQMTAAEGLLRESLVDDSDSERRLLETWLQELRSRAS